MSRRTVLAVAFRDSLSGNDAALLLVVLTLAVAAAVNLAVWGRRQQTLAGRQAGYLAGLLAAAEMGAVGAPSLQLIDHVSGELNRALGLRECRFQHGAAGLGNPPRLCRDGSVEWRHVRWDVEHEGLPVESDIELLVEHDGRLRGRFLLKAAPHSRVTLAQRRLAVALADQVGVVLR